MGYERQMWEVQVRLSRHNSPKDDEHNSLWLQLQEELYNVVNQEKYKPIKPA